MTVNTKEMAGVPVETRSGQPVGKVVSFDLDSATGRLINLRVKTRGLVMTDELVISWDTIIELTRTKVIVADGSVRQGIEAIARTNVTAPASTLMREG